jgi:hypothetical protein
MSDLKDLFERRDKMILTMLDALLRAMPNVVESCEEFIRHNSGGAIPTIEWNNVIYLKDQDNVILVGANSFKIGDEVMLPDGEKITVSEETEDYFKSYLRVSLPFKLVEEGSKDDIYQYLLDKSDDSIDVAEDDGLPQPVQDFDLDQLSEEQRESLKHFLATDSGVEGSDS